jgi:ribosome biogenesis protein ERB1
LIKEHFERCLDLYLCPRLLRKKINVKDPTKLIPELPSPNDLKPFPSALSIEYVFHKKGVRSLAVSPNGLYLASGDEDHNLVIWHTRTSKMMRHYTFPNKVVDCIQWNPDPTLCLLIVANEENVVIILPDLYSKKVNEATRALLN